MLIDNHLLLQRKVFKDLGESVLDNAWRGYNCTLFAYGQTGSGKSYSMVGFGANKGKENNYTKNNRSLFLSLTYFVIVGIVPITCEELFKRVKESQGSGSQYQISVSMLEIYNEQVTCSQ